MNRKIIFGKEAKDKILKGVNIMADAVSVTLGANGKNVLISKSVVVDYGTRSLPIKVTKDGVSVSREVHLEDPIENIGAMMLREASEKTMLQAGDGTTTTVVLARAIIAEGMELMEKGANPMELKKGIDEAVEVVVKNLKRMSNGVGDDVEIIRKIATVSANNDPSIGDLVGQAFSKIGKEGIISIEEAKGVNTEIKITDGFEFDKGYISPYFITDQAKNICELVEPNILIYEKIISSMKVFGPPMEKFISTGKSLLIICEDCDGEAFHTIIANVLQKRIPQCCIVKYPTFGASKVEMMEDIAMLTGATYITDSKGVGLSKATVEHLGKAKRIIISHESTTIIGGEKRESEHGKLIEELRMDLAQEKNEEKKEIIEQRISRLNGGVAVIYVGGPTEVEMKERKDRVDDAVKATKSATLEGYVAGGGISFLSAIRNIPSGQYNTNKTGYDIIFKILEAPIRQICFNAGITDATKVIAQIIQEGDGVGYNAKTGAIENLMEAGIIDPVKVLRCSLQNAASVAGMILTSECIICDSLN